MYEKFLVSIVAEIIIPIFFNTIPENNSINHENRNHPVPGALTATGLLT